MPSPSSSLSTLRPDLGSMLDFDLEANRGKFIANRVLPILEVQEAGGTYGRIPLKQLLKRADAKRGPRGDYNTVDWQFTPDTFSTHEYGLEGPVDANNAAKYANYVDAELETAKLVLHAVLLEAEIRVRDLLFPGAYTPTPVTNEWDDKANATPLDDVDAAVLRIFAATGIWPNAIVFNKKVFRNLQRCDEILDKIAAQGAGDKIKPKDVNVAMLAACFDLEHVIVAEGVYNSAGENLTATPGHIWSDEYAAVGRVAETQSITEPCVGNTFHWAADGSEPGGLVETYWWEPSRCDRVRVRHQVGEKKKYAEMWDVLSNITT